MDINQQKKTLSPKLALLSVLVKKTLTESLQNKEITVKCPKCNEKLKIKNVGLYDESREISCPCGYINYRERGI